MRSATGAMGWLAIMWTAGLMVAAGSLFHGLFSLRRLWREAVPVTDAEVGSALSDSLAAMGGRSPVEVRTTTDIISPAVMWGRPLRILLPVTLERALNPVELRAVLAHELAHLRGQDPWAGLMQAAGCSLFFFNPFVLALSKAADREREALRDAEAAEGIGSRRRYGETLLALAGFQSCVAHVGTHRLVGEGDLAGRIRRLVGPTSETRLTGIRATAMGTIWVLIVTLVIGATATVGTLSSWAVMVDHAEAAALPSSSSTH